MDRDSPKAFIQELIEPAGISFNGTRPWDITVHNEQFYSRVLNEQELGLGESYMDGWWDCPHIDQMIYRLLRSRAYEKVNPNFSFYLQMILHRLINFQTIQGSKLVAKKHYDLGNQLYEKMLDKGLSYSCGYWKYAHDLDQAQEDKLELICRKLQLRPGMTMLDIGCGWGAMAEYAARHYGVQVTGITISEQQKIYAEKRCSGLPVQIKLMDYREMDSKFDRIVSIGMFEHVGYKNYPTFIKLALDNLTDDGLFLLHTIGTSVETVRGNRWITKYIFPNSALPSPGQIAKAIEGNFVLEDWHNFGADYDRTLMAWHTNFNENWHLLKTKYDERFFRMWNYYLLTCAGGFRARGMQLWQIVLSKYGVPGGYSYEPLGPREETSTKNSSEISKTTTKA